MAEYIASGTTEADGADFTLTEGQEVTLFLKAATDQGVPTHATAIIQIKDAGGKYQNVGVLLGKDWNQSVVLSGAGTYRVKRLSGGTAFGVDKV